MLISRLLVIIVPHHLKLQELTILYNISIRSGVVIILLREVHITLFLESWMMMGWSHHIYIYLIYIYICICIQHLLTLAQSGLSMIHGLNPHCSWTSLTSPYFVWSRPWLRNLPCCGFTSFLFYHRMIGSSFFHGVISLRIPSAEV